MNFIAISDTHRQEKDLILPKADMIIHSGDMDILNLDTALTFLDWFSSLDYKYKIFIGGNHDKYLDPQNQKGTSEEGKNIMLEKYPDIVYLEDSSVEIEGIKIYGSPYTPKFGTGWAFQLSRNVQERDWAIHYDYQEFTLSSKKWESIPDDTDILITHGPPMGIRDEVEAVYSPNQGEHVGDNMLMERIKEVNPKFHIFGHIHETAGDSKRGDTRYINASVLNENYKRNDKEIKVWEI